MTPLVSVLLPVRNGARFLPQAIDSVIRQTLHDWHLVLVNDASEDATAMIAANYVAADDRIHVVTRPCRTGVTHALNCGLQHCRGEFIARMDADDVAFPSRFERQLQFLRSRADVVAVGSWVLRVDEDGDPIGVGRWPETHLEIDAGLLQGRGGIPHPTAMIRTSAFRRVGGYREQFSFAQDKDLWLRLAEHGQLANLPEVLLQYREHHLSVGALREAAQRECVERSVADARRRRGLIAQPLVMPMGRATTEAGRRQQWVKAALRDGFRTTAWKHLRWLGRHARLSPTTWRLAARAGLTCFQEIWPQAGERGMRALARRAAMPPAVDISRSRGLVSTSTRWRV